MYKGQVTIKDIAKELGISPSTVSKALNDHPDISQVTKKVVRILWKNGIISLILLLSVLKADLQNNWCYCS